MAEEFWLDPDFILIPITGGPCSGKTSLMAHAKQYLERWYQVFIIPEMATEYILAGFGPQADWKEPLSFQLRLLEDQLYREDRFYRLLCGLHRKKPVIFLVDRGTLDNRAYMTNRDFAEVAIRLRVNQGDLLKRYKMVIHLVTAADGAEEFYTLANNTARTEIPEAARALDKRTQEAWHGHPHLAIIDNSTDFDGKIHRALRAMTRVLGMPDPLEKERRFVVRDFDESMIPQEAVRSEIIQDYLVSSGGHSRRVRLVSLDGAVTYYETTKRKTQERGVRFEDEKIITKDQYDELLTERDRSRRTIYKNRYSFTHQNSHLELDVFGGHLAGKAYLEIEVGNMSDPVHIPEGWDVEDVTGGDAHSNSELAKK